MNRPSARRPTSGRGSPGRRGADGPPVASSWDDAGRGRARRRAAGEPDPPPTDRSSAPAPRRAAPTGGRTGRPARGRPAEAAAEERAPGRRWSLVRRRRRRTSGGDLAPGRPVPVHIRRRRRAAAVAAALALLAGVGAGSWFLLYGSGLADVEDVTVTGLSTVPEQAVRDAAAVPSGGPLIAVDTVGIAGRVAAVQGVAAVYVRRAWPHTVEVNVTERVPVALWQDPQGLFEVDGTGLPYRPAPTPPPAVPRLAFAGVGPQDPATAAALAVLHALPDPVRAQVATVDVAGTKVTLGLADGRSVRWGDPDRASDKIAVLGPLLGQPGKVYDVSSPDLPTVRP